MPVKKTPAKKTATTKKTSSRKTPRRASTRKSSKSKSLSNLPKSTFISKRMSFTSNPNKGEPYGNFEEIVMKNGKGDKIYGKLNKSGKKINTKKSKINNKGENACMPVGIIPSINLHTLMPPPLFNTRPAFVL